MFSRILIVLVVNVVAICVWLACTITVNRTPRLRIDYPDAFADWLIINGPLLGLLIAFSAYILAELKHRSPSRLSAALGLGPAVLIFAYFLLVWTPTTLSHRLVAQ